MSSISIEQRQFTTYLLSTETSQLEVVPERGGIITRWQVQGQEILYLDSDRFADPSLSVRGGIPILFPICGNLPNNTYTHNGQPYTLKQHGFARDLPWAVVGQGTDSSARLVLRLESNNQTRAVYPFDFLLTFTYTLYPDRLVLQQYYTNHSSEPMPFSIGFHPYFLVSNKAQLEFEIPATEFQDQRTQTRHPFAGEFDFNAEELDLAFRSLNQTRASVLDRDRGLRLQLQSSDAFATLVFWTLKGKPFYCLEPWSAPRNALNTGEDLLHLEPGDSLELEFELSVSFR